MRWMTRQRPNLEGLACAWLIRRHIDPEATIERVPGDRVTEMARQREAEPFDLPDPEGSRAGSAFEQLAGRVKGDHRALDHLARILASVSTLRFDAEPEAAGLYALGVGLQAANPDDDDALTSQGMILFDALHAWAGQLESGRSGARRRGELSNDEVTEASEESFPASDPPSFTPTAGSGSPETVDPRH